MTIHVYQGHDDGRDYVRVWGACSHCYVEGEPLTGAPSDVGRLRALAALGADLDSAGLCARCRASAVGAA